MEPALSALKGASIGRAVRACGLALMLLLLSPLPGCSRASLLVFRPEGKDFTEVIAGLKKEIGEDYDIQEQLIAGESRTQDMEFRIRKVNPRLIVLMDNRIINLYRRYQATRPDTEAVTPSISLMAASVEREIAGLKAAAGISYEIPILTSALNLRSVINRPIPRIGIVHREFLRDFVAKNSGYCRKEGIDLAAVSLGNREADFKKSVKTALTTLFENRKIDALWVPNDNALLTPEIIKEVWIPLINKHRKPVMVGVETLVNPKLSFGTFAVLPDHVELGRQLAEKILEISDSGFKLEAGAVDQPLSVIKTVNMRQARTFLDVGTARLGSVDKILE